MCNLRHNENHHVVDPSFSLNKNGPSAEYEQAINFLENGCGCGCSAKVPKERLAELHEAFQALSKPEQDIFLMAQLKAMDGGVISTSRRLKNKIRANKNLLPLKS
ncbi:14246_t:CDS:2 [Ambispora leptoticha]|uniref:14246_t:CDS:1 n=1 Tax=Ambispora leptoticha TaxID=144679 RepID=A0A9N9BZU0_9GLOM|nr:14246_t:CDS:2 [Ambispora leptoticha]